VRKQVLVVSLEDSLSSMTEMHPKWEPSCWEMHQEPPSWLDCDHTQRGGKM
jgi:hypothetical protein